MTSQWSKFIFLYTYLLFSLSYISDVFDQHMWRAMTKPVLSRTEGFRATAKIACEGLSDHFIDFGKNTIDKGYTKQLGK